MSTIVEPTTQQLDDLVEPYLQKYPAGLAFAIGYASPRFQGIYVNGNIHNQYGAPLTLGPDTYLQIASVSKTFTTTLCAAMGAQYQPTWRQQNISDYSLPVRKDGLRIGTQLNSIPLLALANYTSGLPPDDGVSWNGTLPSYPPIPYSPEVMLGFLNATSLQLQSPGVDYVYSNLAFSILGQIIPLFKIGGSYKQFTHLIQEWMLEPLNLYNTYFFEDIPLDQLAVSYFYPSQQSAIPGFIVFPAYYGAGGLVSTPGDMLTWLQFNMGIFKNKLTPFLRETQKASTKVKTGPGGGGLGLGWFLIPESIETPAFVTKNGTLGGFSSFIRFVDWIGIHDSSPAGVFVLTNSDGLGTESTAADEAIANAVLAIMLGPIS